MFLGFGLVLFVAALAWRDIREYFARKARTSSHESSEAPRHHHASV